MEQIASFRVNHEGLERGIYVSRQDGDVLTLDVRMRAPYLEQVLTPTELHSLEHLLATALRQGRKGQAVLYVGPMGCATGFYVLYRDSDAAACVRDVVQGLRTASAMEAMPGFSKAECGNYLTLDLELGKAAARDFLDTVQNKTEPDRYK